VRDDIRKCDWCGTDPDRIAEELSCIQSILECSRDDMAEGDRLRCLDHVFEIRLLLRERSDMKPFRLEPYQ